MTDNDNDPEKKQTDDSEAAEPDTAPAVPAEPSVAGEAEPATAKIEPLPEDSPGEAAAAEPTDVPNPAEVPDQAQPPEEPTTPPPVAEASASEQPSDAEPDATAAEPEVEPAVEAQPDSDEQPAVSAEAATGPEAEAQPEAQAQPETEAQPEPEPPAAPKPEPEPEPEPEPLRIYEYRYIRVRQNAWDEAEQAILGKGAAAVAEAGGQLFGVWAGQIGLSANQGVVVTVWSDLDAAKRGGKAAIVGVDAVVTSETLYLEPTARPADPAAPEGPGMFAHRVFEVRRDDADRFIELSSEAWPQFEEVFGARVFALWRETGHDRSMDRLVLLTRYPDYAAWEASRFWRPDPDPKAADALARFRERREITADTVVYTTRLAVPAAG